MSLCLCLQNGWATSERLELMKTSEILYVLSQNALSACCLLFLSAASAEPTKLYLYPAALFYHSTPSALQKTVAERPLFESEDFESL